MLRNKRGQATVDFLIISMLIFVLIFGAVDYWTTMVRIQQAEHLKNYYLDRCRLEGMLLPDDRTQLISSMDKLGFAVKTIDSPVGRVTQTLDISGGDYPEVWLNITTEFKEQPFIMTAFLNKENQLQPKFKGRALSEYVGP